MIAADSIRVTNTISIEVILFIALTFGTGVAPSMYCCDVRRMGKLSRKASEYAQAWLWLD